MPAVEIHMPFDWVLGTLEFCQAHDILPTIVTLGTNETLKIENMERIFKIAQQYGAKVRINLYRPVQKDCEIRPASLESILKFFDWADREHQIVSISDPLFSALLCGDTIAPIPPEAAVYALHRMAAFILPPTYCSRNFLWEISGIFIWTQTFRETRAPTGYYMHRFHLPVKMSEGIRMPGRCFGPRYLWYKDFKERDPYCFAEHPELFRHYHTHKEAFASVHDGYLPTLSLKIKEANL